jgi:hypothetical protein
MNICWVLSNQAQLDPTVEIDSLKKIGSFWGGWKTWRSCQTDNVICNDRFKAAELLKRNFHNSCNFYIPSSIYIELNRPQGVNLFEGNFIQEVDNQEDIISMHLATGTHDIILLIGFDFGEYTKQNNQLEEHKAQNYRNLTRRVILDNPNIQWVVIDHAGELRKDLCDLPNLGQDTLKNIITV